MKKTSIILLLLVVLLSQSHPVKAESTKMKILKGVYDVAKDFIKSDSAVYFQGSAAYIPGKNSTGYLNNYTPGQSNNLYYQQPYSGYQNNYYPVNSTSYTGSSSYYPVNTQNYLQDEQLTTGQGFYIQPQSNVINPTGEIFLLNARKEDVHVILEEFCTHKGWGLKEIRNNASREVYDTIPDALQITFNRYGYSSHHSRNIVISIRQVNNGTVINTYSSAFLVKDQISELLSHFNTYYDTQVSNFQ